MSGLRILHFAESFWPAIGGIETLLARLLPAQAVRGHHVELVASPAAGRPEAEAWSGATVHRIGFRDALLSRDLEAMVRVRRGIEAIRSELRPDLTHVHFSGPAVFFHLQTMRSSPSPWIVTLHAPLPDSAAQPGSPIARFLGAADKLVAVSDALLWDVRRIVPETTSRSVRIHNAHPLGGDTAIAPAPAAPMALCIGRVIEEKGFDTAIRAIARLAERGLEIRLRIAGDGPALPGLDALAGELGVADRVELRGWIEPDRMAAEIDAATVIIVPSRWAEPFGLVALEAAARGRPVIAARAGGLPEVVADGETGLIVAVDDDAALAAALARLVSDPTLARSLGERGLVRVRERFAMQPFVEAYDEVYADVLAAVGAPTVR